MFCFGNLNAQDINPNGYNTFYHSNGEIASEGYFKDGLPSGLWKSYNTTGILNAQGNKLNGLSDSV